MTDMDSLSGSIEDEIMVLQSIYEDKLDVKKDGSGTTVVTIMLHPATADDSSTQFVKLLLELILPKQYPSLPLQVNFKMSRGLSDDQLEKLKLNLNKHASESDESSILFDIIEMAKDALTVNNIPSCPCPICLSSFNELDDFLKTECYHYLHSYCMHDYVVHHRNEMNKSELSSPKHRSKKKPPENVVPCPVCREPVPFDLEVISKSAAPIDNEPVTYDFSKLKLQVKLMGKIYNRQKERGGIIDLDAEKNKYLLSSIEQAYARSSYTDHQTTSGKTSKSTPPKEESSETKVSEDQEKADTNNPKQRLRSGSSRVSDEITKHFSKNTGPRKSDSKEQNNNRFPFRRHSQQTNMPPSVGSSQPHRNHHRRHHHKKAEHAMDRTSQRREGTNKAPRQPFNSSRVTAAQSAPRNARKNNYNSRNPAFTEKMPSNSN